MCNKLPVRGLATLVSQTLYRKMFSLDSFLHAYTHSELPDFWSNVTHFKLFNTAIFQIHSPHLYSHFSCKCRIAMSKTLHSTLIYRCFAEYSWSTFIISYTHYPSRVPTYVRTQPTVVSTVSSRYAVATVDIFLYRSNPTAQAHVIWFPILPFHRLLHNNKV